MSRISTYYICVITFLLCCVPNYLGAQSTSNVGDEVIAQVNQTLVKAGSNRSELEKVLAHYRGDDLKYKAACFLIANMDAHYSYASDGINSYYKEMDSVFSLPIQDDSIYKNTYYHASVVNGDLRNKSYKVYDNRVLSSDFLIKEINTAFVMWKQSWNMDLDFSLFCEYVIPYRITNEPFSSWRKLYQEMYLDKYKYLLFSQTNYTIKYGLYKELNKGFYGALYYPITYLPDMSLELLLKMRMGNCESNAKRNIAQLRAMGIPSTLDFVPQWGNRSLSHSWGIMFIDDEKFIPFGLNENLGTHFYYRPNHKIPKVYRYTYRKQHEMEEYCADTLSSTPQDLHNPCILDVTDKYTETTDLTLTLDTLRKGYKSPWIYLCVFDDSDWMPVCFAKREGGKAKFSKVGRGIVYLPASINKIGELVPEGNPFILATDGSRKEIVLDKQYSQRLRAVRKYTLTVEQKDYCHQMEDGEFHVANNSNFSDSVIIAVAKDVNESRFYSIKPKYKGDYRYFRYMAPAGSYGNVGEIELYGKDGEKLSHKRVYGYRWTEKGHEQAKLYDGDPLTSFTLQATKRGWCGVEFEEPVHLSEIRFIPRNDGNYIIEGDTYQLYYWDNGDWQMAGEQKGNREGVLWFDKVPSKALFLLRDITQGKQERIFTYENGEQIWW